MDSLFKRSYFALMLIIATSIGTVTAQQTGTRRVTPNNIFEALKSNAPGEGVVVINQSTELRNLVGGVSSKYRAVLGREGNTSVLQGYRIQVYNGNLSNSKAEMEKRAVQVRRLAPEYSCYTSFNAPFWRLAVGDFISQEAARNARNKLLKIMPSWFNESYIVKDRVRIVNYNPELNEY